jgi:hypothetical protein
VFSNIKENQPQKFNPSSIDTQSRYYLAKSKEQIPKPSIVNCKGAYRGMRRLKYFSLKSFNTVIVEVQNRHLKR